MKVVLIFLGRRGGGCMYSYEMARNLQSQVDLLTIFSNQAENFSDWNSLNCIKFPVSTYNNVRSFLFSSLNFKKFFKIKRVVDEFSPDVIYFPFFHLWLPIFYILFPNFKKVFTLHDPVLHSGEKNIFVNWIQNYVISRSDKVIILSTVFKKYLNSKGVDDKKIKVLPHGVFDHYFNNYAHNRKDEEKHVTTLLFFGRIFDYKGLDVVLEAFKRIEENFPDVRLLIVGSGNIKKYNNNLSMLKNVVLVNKWLSDEEVGYYFSQSDILLCPYKDATQSGVVSVAYAFGLPVIATNVGGLEEQVKDKITGILIRPNNVNDLFEACVKLISDPVLRVKMGYEAKKLATEQLGWKKISSDLLNFFTID